MGASPSFGNQHTAVTAGGPEFSLASAAATSSLAICTTITATVPIALTDA